MNIRVSPAEVVTNAVSVTEIITHFYTCVSRRLLHGLDPDHPLPGHGNPAFNKTGTCDSIVAPA